MTFRIAVLVAGLGVVASMPSYPVRAAPSVQIKVGGDPQLPACQNNAVLNDREVADGRVEVRSGPARSFRVLDRLPVGTTVYACDESGTFIGIVYGDEDCGLQMPSDPRAPYRGDCASGWVHNRSVDRAGDNST